VVDENANPEEIANLESLGKNFLPHFGSRPVLTFYREKFF
jgi:hypothetical protein